ncbi:hypothetical protein [Isoptericola aurantiacus]|uniref:hypothetical protein n=1 Tax=Isoptericola aurantiacus TaxID=3377839 RepID=UPI00383B65B6
MSAPGRVVTTARNAWHSWQCHACGEDRKSLPCHRAFLEVGDAADALREHLRTEHPDLLQRCEECEGSGTWAHYPAGPMWGPEILGCPTCHGNGWTFTDERSKP